MNWCKRAVILVVATLAPLGCAPRTPSALVPLDPNSELLSSSNAPWRSEQARRVVEFKETERATLWRIGQDLRGRISSAWPPPDAPIRFGDYEYFAADGPGDRYPIFYRRGSSGEREDILDLNREFPTGTVDIGLLRISPDNSKLAISLDTEGTGIYRLFTRILPDGDLSGPLAESVHEAEWASGGNLFFTALTELRATKLFRIPPTGDLESVPLPLGKDGHLALHPSGDGQMIVREISPQGGTTWRIQPAEKKIRPVKLSLRGASWRSAATIDGCTYRAGTLLLVEREQRRDLVWSGAKSSRGPEEIPLGAEAAYVTGIRCYTDHAIAFGRASNRAALWYLSANDASPQLRRVVLPLGLTALTLGAHPSPEISAVRVQLSSLINPPILYELDLKNGIFSPRAQRGVVNHNAERYTTAQLVARAPDGAAIPITVAYSLDTPSATVRPVVITAYGAYGTDASTEFNDFYLPLLERGFVVAVAHIRGGGEGGPAWHDASAGVRKSTGTGDLIAATEALHRLGWGSNRRTALLGRSAGAIPLAGAAALRPDLFGAVVLDAPFLDPARALSDTAQPLVIRELAEWGDPADPTVREAMRRYAPFDLPVGANYPPTLVTVHAHDAAVSPLDGARWVERLEGTGVSGSLISITSGTHAGPTTRSEATDEAALRAIFILVHVGMR